MRNRRFTLLDSAAALKYITHLLSQGIRFEVVPCADGVDVITPFAIEPRDFPEAAWLKPSKPLTWPQTPTREDK
jgi:hypothetical protein